MKTTTQSIVDAGCREDLDHIFEEFRKSYSDCVIADMSREDCDRALRTRRLVWKSDRAIPLAEAARCYAQMAMRYNEFDPDMIAELARAFPNDAITVTPAREYSVAVYIHVPFTPGLRSLVKQRNAPPRTADEVAWIEDGILRCWWD